MSRGLTPEQKQYVKDNFPQKKVGEIAKDLRLKVQNVSYAITSMGLRPAKPKVGDKLGKLTINKFVKENDGTKNRTYVICDCECGTKNKKVLLTSLVNNITVGCGSCIRFSRSRFGDKKYENGSHGMINTKIYRRWGKILDKCYNKNDPNYNKFGGRGIVVCDDWKDFVKFYEWAKENNYNDELMLDRINKDKNFCPENCRFVNRGERRTDDNKTKYYMAFGEIKSLFGWSEDPRCIVGHGTLKKRISLGWSMEDAMTKSVEYHRPSDHPELVKERNRVKRKKQKWSDDENKILLANLDVMNYRNIGKLLGRTKVSVFHQAKRLGLKRNLPKVGDKYNRLTITKIFYKHNGKQNIGMALCDCDCGTKDKEVILRLVYKKVQISCGCVAYTEIDANNQMHYQIGHGLSNTKIYRRWHGMLARCNNPNIAAYRNYGGRGIKVCEEWYDFMNFYNWAISVGYNEELYEDLSIDRINVNGNYEPSNCRFIDMIDQCNNRRSNVYYEAWGEKKTIREWINDPRCAVKGYRQLATRLRMPLWTVEDALTIPIGATKNKNVNEYKNKINKNGVSTTADQNPKL